MRSTLFVLALLLGPSSARAADPVNPVKTAIDRGLKRIEQGSANYIKNRQCFSCHHQAVAIHVMAAARRRGFAVEAAKLNEQVDFTVNTFRVKKERIAKGESVPGGNTMTAYALFALEGAGHAGDDTTTALIEYLLVRQRNDGSWPALTQRPPSEGSSFTNAALALRALRHYTPAKDAKDADELRTRMDKAFAKGRNWVLKNEPSHMEDKAFRLRALVNAGADDKEIARAQALLLKEQRDDGSWSQLTDLEGDAYATGIVLAALRCAGLASTDAQYQKAVKYLLASQQEDGAWLVTTRSRPVQTFFDNGDPGGKSQFISFAATTWAVLALLETVTAK